MCQYTLLGELNLHCWRTPLVLFSTLPPLLINTPVLSYIASGILWLYVPYYTSIMALLLFGHRIYYSAMAWLWTLSSPSTYCLWHHLGLLINHILLQGDHTISCLYSLVVICLTLYCDRNAPIQCVIPGNSISFNYGVVGWFLTWCTGTFYFAFDRPFYYWLHFI